jgi:hypothetical protein
MISICIVSIIACVNKEKEYTNSIIKKESLNLKTSIDFKEIISLYDSNQKVIDASSIAFQKIKELDTLKLILKIKKDHAKIGEDLKKIAAKNLIIIPKSIINLDVIYLKNEKSNYYILSFLKKAIDDEIKYMELIKESNTDIELKVKIDESLLILQKNLVALSSKISQ